MKWRHTKEADNSGAHSRPDSTQQDTPKQSTAKDDLKSTKVQPATQANEEEEDEEIEVTI